MIDGSKAFSGKVDTGFPLESATKSMIESELALSG